MALHGEREYSGRPGDLVPPTLAALREWWRRDAHFIGEHHLVACSGAWLARIDGDVTLIAGRSDFMERVVRTIGPRVFAWMEADYDVDISEDSELADYLRRITRGLPK